MHVAQNGTVPTAPRLAACPRAPPSTDACMRAGTCRSLASVITHHTRSAPAIRASHWTSVCADLRLSGLLLHSMPGLGGADADGAGCMLHACAERCIDAHAGTGMIAWGRWHTAGGGWVHAAAAVRHVAEGAWQSQRLHLPLLLAASGMNPCASNVGSESKVCNCASLQNHPRCQRKRVHIALGCCVGERLPLRAYKLGGSAACDEARCLGPARCCTVGCQDRSSCGANPSSVGCGCPRCAIAYRTGVASCVTRWGGGAEVCLHAA